MKKIILILCALSTFIFISCGNRSDTNTVQSSGSQSGDVHMSDQAFVQTTVSIHKGNTITLTDDTGTPHIIQNGIWNQGSQQPLSETGAPATNITFNGHDSHSIGPFNTAGTYNFYCTVHSGMNLIVHVQ